MEIPIELYLIATITLVAWLVFIFWQIKLIKRIIVVSNKQHKIPSNIFWLKRAQQAIETDTKCHSLWRKRNISALIFLFSIILVGCLMAYIVLNRV